MPASATNGAARRRRLVVAHVLVAALALALALALAPATAAAAPQLPPAGTVFHGVASGDDVADFRARSGRRPAVWQHWIKWGGPFEHTFRRAERTRTRLMLHLGTSVGQGAPEVISPGAIARGRGDAWLLALARGLAAYGRPAYLRPFGEMNNCDLPYAAFDCNGARRNAAHSAASLKRAWRRIVLVVRGGDVARIDARLRGLRMPALRTDAATLPRPRVGIVWSPMTGGSPMIAALRPEAYWPGPRWTDWVATSFYSMFPNFRWLTPFYERFAVRHDKPFAFAEWAMWGADSASFARRLYAWMRSHPRTRMAIYNQGARADGPFRLRRFPRAAAVIRREARSRRFAAPARAHP